MMDHFRGRRVEECRFVITGPSQSGKSTLLFIAASLFSEKLELVGQTLEFLVLPFNWAKHPILEALQRWLLLQIAPRGFPPIPALALRFKGLPKEALQQMAHEIHAEWKNKADLAAFVELTIAWPGNIARAFGFTGECGLRGVSERTFADGVARRRRVFELVFVPELQTVVDRAIDRQCRRKRTGCRGAAAVTQRESLPRLPRVLRNISKALRVGQRCN
jgi:hypothetical protein